MRLCLLLLATAIAFGGADRVIADGPETAIQTPVDPRITPETLKAFAPGEFTAEGMTLPYRLLSPSESAAGELHPLLLFLHGYGERGDENQMQLVHGGNLFASEEFRRRHRAFVVAPQCPAGTEPRTVSADPNDAPDAESQRFWTWPLNRRGDQALDLSGPMTPQLAAVRRLVEELIAANPVDVDRVYVCGLSMGGYATWELVTREPGLWAAAAPVCGAGDPTKADRLTKLPIWNFHGGADGVIPAERSRTLVSAIRAAGGRVIYTEYEGVGHDSWTPTFASRQVWDWLFAQRR